MFNTIKVEDVNPPLRYPYAHTMSLLVLVGFHELKNTAMELLSALPLAGGEPASEVASMLAILKGVSLPEMRYPRSDQNPRRKAGQY